MTFEQPQSDSRSRLLDSQPRRLEQPLAMSLRDRYSLDVRSLALLRIGLALVLLLNLLPSGGGLVSRFASGAVMNDGFFNRDIWLLPALTSLPIVQVLLSIVAVLAAIAMLFGYHSRLATIASWVLLIALSSPGAAASMTGDVLRAVMFWAMFLPLGAAYSVDRAMNTSTRPVPIKLFTGATIALMVQQGCIYILPAAFRGTNGAQLPNGEAVRTFLSSEPAVTGFGQFLLNLGPLLTIVAIAVLFLEWIGPLLLWWPIHNDRFRMIAIALCASLYILFGLILNLGLFPLLGVVTLLAFLPTSTWESMSDRVYGSGYSADFYNAGSYSAGSYSTSSYNASYSSGSEGSDGEALKRSGLRIFYDADCGFCKKVVHLIRMLLVLPHTPLATAQSIPEINTAMETQNSWVIVDWQGRHHYKFEAITYVVSLSPVFSWVATILRWSPIMAGGTRLYEWIANNRKKAGILTRPFKFKPLKVVTPNWLSAIALLLLLLSFV
ncbi:MAG: DCC1-like thiol-disulfide oxidoreductase family protein [Cyanobacteria bacterium J06634_5]